MRQEGKRRYRASDTDGGCPADRGHTSMQYAIWLQTICCSVPSNTLSGSKQYVVCLQMIRCSVYKTRVLQQSDARLNATRRASCIDKMRVLHLQDARLVRIMMYYWLKSLVLSGLFCTFVPSQTTHDSSQTMFNSNPYCHVYRLQLSTTQGKLARREFPMESICCRPAPRDRDAGTDCSPHILA